MMSFARWWCAERWGGWRFTPCVSVRGQYLQILSTNCVLLANHIEKNSQVTIKNAQKQSTRVAKLQPISNLDLRNALRFRCQPLPPPMDLYEKIEIGSPSYLILLLLTTQHDLLQAYWWYGIPRHSASSPACAVLDISSVVNICLLEPLHWETQNPSIQPCHNSHLETVWYLSPVGLFAHYIFSPSRCNHPICYPSSMLTYT